MSHEKLADASRVVVEITLEIDRVDLTIGARSAER